MQELSCKIEVGCKCNIKKCVYDTDLFLLSDSDFNIWVLDTTSGSYFYSSLLQLQNIKDLKRGNLKLYDASRESISTEAVETCMLDLPSGKTLELKDYYLC